LRPLETFQLFYWAWNQVHTSMTIKFEERFADSRKILSSVCDFIGISRTEDQIVMAIRNSTFDKSARVEARVLDSPIKHTHHRAGIEFEWKTNTESFEVAKLMSVPTPNPDSPEYSVPETFVGVQNISLLIAHRASQGASFIGQEIRRHYATLQKSVIPDARLLERAIERQMCFEPTGSKTSLSLYSCGIRIAMKIRNLSLLTLSIRAWKLEILSALRRRLTG
jgi:hypothetical protein